MEESFAEPTFAMSTSATWAGALAHTRTRGACSPPSVPMDPALSSGASTLVRWLRPKPLKRVAVAFSGLFRNNQPGNTRDTMRRTMDSYRKHLELVNPDYECDFFFHVYVHSPAAGLDVHSIEYLRTFPNVRALVVEVFTQDIVDGFVADFGVAPFAEYLPGFNATTDCPGGSPWHHRSAMLPINCGNMFNFGLLSSMRKIYLANELVKSYSSLNDVDYNFVIRARLDRFLGADLVLSDLPKDKITSPVIDYELDSHTRMYAWPYWMEDQFAIAPPTLMDRYASLYTQVHNSASPLGQVFEFDRTQTSSLTTGASLIRLGQCSRRATRCLRTENDFARMVATSSPVRTSAKSGCCRGCSVTQK